MTRPPNLEERAALAELQSRLFQRKTRPVLKRYELEKKIGKGGMGLVFSAWDTELARSVAVKLLRRPNRGDLVDRMLREARVLAQLEHPNIVHVYDVGRYDEGVFIVMELIEGDDLKTWLRKRPRNPDEVLDVFLAAGRGLAAAHREGIVHRDFKPANVIAGDGFVKVVDFGLARSFGETVAGASRLTSGTATMTARGVAVGTPAYMPPEQRRGGKVDARADQFSFCVSLAEALEDLEVPSRVRRVIRRGSRAEPGRRFPSMDALLDALDPPRRGALPAVALGAAVTLLLAIPVRDERPSTCPEVVADRAAVMWNSARERRVAAGLPAVRRQPVLETLDAYATRWLAEAEQVCGETEARAPCLESRALEFVAVTDLLSEADQALAARARDVVARLLEPSECEDAVEEAEETVRTLLARARAAQIAARHEDALALAREAKELAQTPKWRDEAALREAYLLGAMGQREEASALLERTYFAAIEAGRSHAAGVSAALLVQHAKLEDARRWAQRARAALSQTAGHPGTEEMLEHNLGGVLLRAGNEDEAETHFKRAVESVRRRSGHKDFRLASYLAALGTVYAETRPAEALPLLEESLAIRRETLGDAHPEVAESLDALAIARHASGDEEAALDLFRHALQIRVETLPPEDPRVVGSQTNLGIALTNAGLHDEGIEHLERAYAATRRPSSNPTHRAVVGFELGRTYLAAGREDDGRRLVRSAREAAGSDLGYDHPIVKEADRLLER